MGEKVAVGNIDFSQECLFLSKVLSIISKQYKDIDSLDKACNEFGITRYQLLPMLATAKGQLDNGSNKECFESVMWMVLYPEEIFYYWVYGKTKYVGALSDIPDLSDTVEYFLNQRLPKGAILWDCLQSGDISKAADNNNVSKGKIQKMIRDLRIGISDEDKLFLSLGKKRGLKVEKDVNSNLNIYMMEVADISKITTDEYWYVKRRLKEKLIKIDISAQEEEVELIIGRLKKVKQKLGNLQLLDTTIGSIDSVLDKNKLFRKNNLRSWTLFDILCTTPEYLDSVHCWSKSVKVLRGILLELYGLEI